MSLRDKLLPTLKDTLDKIFSANSNCRKVFTAAFGSNPGHGSVDALIANANNVIFVDETRVGSQYLGDVVPGIEKIYAGATVTQAAKEGGYYGWVPRLESTGKAGNHIVIASKFYTYSVDFQKATLVHEMLHVYTKLSDVDLAKALKWDNPTQDGASASLSNYLLNDCKH